MIKFRRQSGITYFLLLTLLLMMSSTVMAAETDNNTTEAYSFSFTEERLSEASVTSDVIYKTTLNVKGPVNTGTVTFNFVFDSDLVTPIVYDDYRDGVINEADLTSTTDMYNFLRVGNKKFNLAVVKTENLSGTMKGVNIPLSNTESAGLDISKGVDIVEIYYKISNPDSMYKGAFNVVKNSTLWGDATGAAVRITDKGTGAWAYLPDTDCTYDKDLITLTSFTYNGSDKATLLKTPSVTLTTIAPSGSGGLTVTVTDSVNTGDALAALKEYKVQLYNEAGTEKVGDVLVIAKSDTTATVALSANVIADTKYTATVIAVADPDSAYKDSVESAKCAATPAGRATAVPDKASILKKTDKITADTIVIPLAGEDDAVVEYTAEVYDQYGTKMDDNFSWGYTGTLPSNVTVEKNKVTVPSNASTGSFTLNASGSTYGKEATATINIVDMEVNWPSDNMVKTPYVYGTTNAGAVTLPASGTATAGNALLDGTFSVLNPDEVQQVGSRTITVQFEVTTEGDYKGQVITKDYPVVITAKSVAPAMIQDIAAVTYNGSAQEPTVVVKDGTKTLKLGTDYTVVGYSNNKNAGTAAKVTIEGMGNYTGEADKNFTINPKELTITVMIADKIYDGKDIANVSGVTFGGLIAPDKLGASDYTATGTFAGKDAASDQAVTGTVTLKATDVAKNYSLANNGAFPAGTKATIKKAPAFKQNTPYPNVSVVIDQARAYTEPVKPSYSVTDMGAITYKYKDDTGDIINATAATIKLENGTLSFTSQSVDQIGKKGTVTFITSSTNYEDMDTVIDLTTVDKVLVKFTGLTFTNKVYDGTAIKPAGALVSDPAYTGATEYLYDSTDKAGYSSADAPKNAGEYQLTVSIPDANVDFMGSNVFGPFAITKAALTAQPKSYEIYVNDAMPDLAYDYEGFVAGDTAAVVTASGATLAVYANDGTLLAGTSAAGTYTIKFNEKASFTADNYDVTVKTGTLTINTRSSGGSSGGGGGGATTTKVPVSSSTGSVSVNATVSNGTATLDIDTKDLAKVTAADDITIDLTAMGKSVQAAVISKEAVKAIADSEASGLSLVLDSGTVTFDGDALGDIVSQAAGNTITLSAKQVSTSSLSNAQKDVIGDHENAVIVDITLQSGGKSITGFAGSAMVSIPYELKEGQNPDNLTVWYLDPNGAPQEIPCTYKDGKVFFSTNHFSLYMVAYLPGWDNPFTDVSRSDWFYNAVGAVVTEGLFNGTGATTFSPNSEMTRAMFVTVLGRMQNVHVAGYWESSFDDVEIGSWYGGYVEWAYQNGIVLGTSDTTFDPDAPVTREQMATLITRYFTYLKQGPSGTAAQLTYTDLANISAWASEGVAFCTAKGLLAGYPDGSFKPQNNATRAEVATIFQRILEL